MFASSAGNPQGIHVPINTPRGGPRRRRRTRLLGPSPGSLAVVDAVVGWAVVGPIVTLALRSASAVARTGLSERLPCRDLEDCLAVERAERLPSCRAEAATSAPSRRSSAARRDCRLPLVFDVAVVVVDCSPAPSPASSVSTADWRRCSAAVGRRAVVRRAVVRRAVGRRAVGRRADHVGGGGPAGEADGGGGGGGV